MLVLSRRPQQSIMIGDDVVVTVLEVKGDQVRLGITAPRDVTVHREEVLVSIAQQGARGTDEARDAVPAQRQVPPLPRPRRSPAPAGAVPAEHSPRS